MNSRPGPRSPHLSLPTSGPLPASRVWPRRRQGSPAAALAALAFWLTPAAALAGIRFDNCVQGTDGSLTCDTVPTGNTYLNDKAAQYGLFQNASPGWNEFDPYQGFDQELGGGED